MARLFVGPREQQFIADITKEYIKDIVGQYIIYYPVSMINTQIHPVYEEAVQKIFEKPIKIDCIAGQSEPSREYNSFGIDKTSKIEILIQSRDLIDKNLELQIGDFFIYGSVIYEIDDLFQELNIFGQDDYSRNWRLTGILARTGNVDLETFGQLLVDAKNFKQSEVQKTFQQQRGLKQTSVEGNTGDVRQMRERLGDEMAPIALGEGPREVVQEENEKSSTFEHSTNTLYDDI